MPTGNYAFEVIAADVDGNSIETVSFMVGQVTGVRYLDNRATLLMGDREVPFESIIEVVEPEAGNNQ